VQKFLVLTEHIITPRMPIVNEAFWKGLRPADRDTISAALASVAAWQDRELLSQEATLVGTFKAAGMTVIEPDVALWRKPVLDKVPAQFEDKWGKGTFDSLLKL
jgi:TRAP-type C4-dicarboxylate transport system substrate-binding protein